MSASEEQSQGPVIRDRRRIDPVTGLPRETEQSAGSGQAARGASQARPGKHSVSKPGSLRPEAAGASAEPGEDGASQSGSGQGQSQPGDEGDGAGKAGQDELSVKLAERTADLQRVQAEYANYRKRVDRDRIAVREHALASVVAELLPVLDDIGRAREHGELTGGFKAVAESLEAATVKLGLTSFGEPGEAFDPNVHEALMHAYSPEVTETTCVQVLQPGYKVGDRILRPARVAVAEPSDPAGARTASGDGPEQAQADAADGSGQAGSGQAGSEQAGSEQAGQADGQASDQPG